MMIKFIKKIISWVFTFIARVTSGKLKADIHVNGFTILTKMCEFGQNVNFNGLKVYGLGKCLFGSNFHSGKTCKILTAVHNYKGNKIPYDETIIHKDVIIGDNVWIGMGVTILGGVEIGEGAIIQAESVVVSNIPKLGIAGGHPAKVFAYRDNIHYDKLKLENSFL